jgi:hypothetical protein
MSNQYDPEDLWNEDSGVLTMGDDHLRDLMSRALALVPRHIADTILESCLFNVINAETGGEYIPAYFIDGRALICFQDSIFSESDESQIRTFLHECAHRILDHKSPLNAVITFEESIHQESDAWSMVDDWVGPAK